MSVAEIDDNWSPGNFAGRPLPRPAGYPVLGLLPKLRHDQLMFFVRTVRDLGDVVELDLGLNKALMFNHPRHIRHVLQDNHANYHKSKFYGPLKPILGSGIFLAEDQAWLHQRRTSAKGFQGCRLKQMVDDMTAASADMIDRWHARRQDGAIDMVPEMMRVTLDIVLRTLLSVRLDGAGSDVSAALTTILRDAERRVWSFATLPLWAPTPNNRACRAALQVLDDFVHRIIAERRADPEGREDLLQILVDAQPEQLAAGMPETLLRDQVLSTILAGHETTANSLSWTWYLLSRHPDVARRLGEELATVLGGRVPTFQDMARLKYTKMVFEEAMRLYPPVWTISRTALADDEIDGVRIPKGTTVMLCAYAVHRRPELWPNPEGFDPERFDPDRPVARDRYAYFPFGGGPRNCLGSRFATLEAMIIMAMVCQTFRLELVPGQAIEPEPMITLRPRGELLMHLREV